MRKSSNSTNFRSQKNYKYKTRKYSKDLFSVSMYVLLGKSNNNINIYCCCTEGILEVYPSNTLTFLKERVVGIKVSWNMRQKNLLFLTLDFH